VATASSLGVDLAPSQQVLSVAEPPPRKGGGTVPDVDGLVAALKKTGLVK